ncbi:hypothetical protein [Salmonirosea aquatica]|uniref:Uncharacterized protein n=1 Tax=Salmonirosea aquatica TaxID=2654236 RepID=A0A7C9BGI2_9BACT|nr:hypothetical protein [Cytophagaceae bacterium SJW1-29]
MKPYPYSLTELIQDDDFIAWVLHPDVARDAHWNQYLLDYPEKKQMVEDAKGYVILLAEDTGRHRPSPDQSTKMWGAVEQYVVEEHKREKKGKLFLSRLNLFLVWLTLLLMISILGYWYYTRYHIPDPQLVIGR